MARTVVNERILLDPEICSGKPVIAGTRIMVRNILGIVADGGTVAPGGSLRTLTVSTLGLSDGSILDFELGAPGDAQDLIVVTSDGGLTLDGILNGNGVVWPV